MKNKKPKLVPCDSCYRLKHDIDCKSCYHCKCKACGGTGKVIESHHLKCNNCAGSMGNENSIANSPQQIMGVQINTWGGYQSDYLNDLNHYEFNICEKCLRQMFQTFKIKPEISDYNHKRVSFEEDQVAHDDTYNYHGQRDDRLMNDYKNQICNVIMECKNKAVYTLNFPNEENDQYVVTDFCCCEDHVYYSSKFNRSKLSEYVPPHLRAFE